MAERLRGTITRWTDVAPGLAIFRIANEPGVPFPAYSAGQSIALTRDHCRLSRKSVDETGRVSYVPATNADGSPVFGTVTHAYSLASAPFDTEASGEIEIYITLERHGEHEFGRLTESLFTVERHLGDTIGYVNRIVGNFTLAKRAKDARHVLMVATGTGLAPFVGMIRQAAHEARQARGSDVQYTLLHANRTTCELGYDAELRALAEERIPGFDFRYVRSVSRPTPADAADASLCHGRANNLLRALFGLPSLERERAAAAELAGAERAAAVVALERSVPAVFASGVSPDELRSRTPGGATTVMTCGNMDLMNDIREIAGRLKFRFEMEEW